jgi:polar amino acid transport system substrate-binding protein
VSHRFPIERALEAYDLITGKARAPYLGVLLQYPDQHHQAIRSRVQLGARVQPSGSPAIGFVGAGHFAQSYLLPTLVKQRVELRGVATVKPANARAAAEKFGFSFCSSDASEVIGDDVDVIFVTTRHDTHARYVVDALGTGRHVFVEKPLAVSREELDAVREAAIAAAADGRYLAVGYNRRFSRPVLDIAEFLRNRREPLSMTYTVNAGFIPRSSWMQSPEQGGRIVGEGCHFFDVFAFLTRARPVRVYAAAAETDNVERSNDDTASIVVTYEDGSLGTLVYTANGSDRVPKEHLVVSAAGSTAVMRNFREVHFYGGRSTRRAKYDGRKGHVEEVENFLSVVRGVQSPAFTVDELVMTTAVSLAARESVSTRETVIL